MSLKLLIDSDILVFKACYATQYTVYDTEVGSFRRKKELVEYVNLQYDDEEAEEILKNVQPRVVKEPIKATFRALDSMIESCMRETDADSYVLVVKGEKENFRKDIPYPVPYKGNRAQKPDNYQACMDYLKTLPSCVYAEGIEVDDMLGILQDKESDTTAIASIDKDLKQIPGLHYHLDKKQLYKVTEEDGICFFWRQMLMGDRVDNIIGVKGIGPVTAENLIQKDMHPNEMESIVRNVYQKEWGEKWNDMFVANQRLLHIMKDELELMALES